MGCGGGGVKEVDVGALGVEFGAAAEDGAAGCCVVVDDGSVCACGCPC